MFAGDASREGARRDDRESRRGLAQASCLRFLPAPGQILCRAAQAPNASAAALEREWPLGKLQRQGRSSLELAADPGPATLDRLRGGARARASGTHEPLAGVLEGR